MLVAEGLNGVAELPNIPPLDVVDGVAPNIPPLPPDDADVVDVVAPNMPLGAGADVAPKIPPLDGCDGAEFVDVKAGLAPNVPPDDFFVSPKANPLVGFELPKTLPVFGACVPDC